MGNMQLKEIVSIQAASINPMDAPDKLFHLYSLPSFDENQKREEVYGRQIQSNKSIVPDKCILFNKLNVRFQRIWLIDNDDEDKICSTEFLPLIVDETKVDFYYCYFLLHSPGITNYLTGQNTNTSGSHKRIDPDDFLSIEVQLPTLPEQKRIGKFLYDIEKKITVNRQINDYLDAMARQLYDYWFVQFDFPDENGKPYKSSGGKMVWNEKLKREIPGHWNENNLGGILDVFDFRRVPLSSIQRSTMKGIYPYYGATGIMDFINDYIFDGEYVLLAEDGSTSAPDGSPIVQYIWGKNWVNNHAHIILPKERRHIHYTFLQLKSIPAKMMETGSIQKKISQENLLKQRVVVPSKDIKDAFEVVVTPLWEEKKNATEQINSLLKQRDELLPLLMNGQVSVMRLNNHLSHD